MQVRQKKIELGKLHCMSVGDRGSPKHATSMSRQRNYMQKLKRSLACKSSEAIHGLSFGCRDSFGSQYSVVEQLVEITRSSGNTT